MKEIDSLMSKQEKDGNFISFSSPNPKNFTNAISYHTTFITSLTLSALCSLNKTPQLKIVEQRAVKFLLSQKSMHWSWNYWERNSKESKTMPYPDDLDDTFCALNALFLYDKNIIDGEALANIVNLLTTLEAKEGGPYKTWLVDKKAKKIWKDVDLAVNSNIAYFLFLNEIEIPNLSRFIESKIAKLDFISPYYPTPFPIIYFISRFYHGRHKQKIIDFLLRRQNKNKAWENPLNTALAVSSLLNLNYPSQKLKSSIEYILRNKKNGLWQANAFCLDPVKNDKKFYAGSPVLTTAFCLEALAKYYTSTVIPPLSGGIQKQEKIYNTILLSVEKRLSKFDNSFKKIALDYIKKLTKNNTDKQILLLPYFFTQTLGDKKNKMSEKVLIQLGTANLFGWIAYTIYDNFLDEEGDPKTISLANIALKEIQKIFINILPNNKSWQIFFPKILDQIDNANYWEVIHCRNKKILPNYGNNEKLAEKSLGHALGPLAVLFSLGLTEKSQDIKSLIKFFKHYIIARQLNDDAHDWEKDYKKGHINPVVVLLLEKTAKQNVIPAQAGIQKIQLKKLKKLFWEKVLEEVSLIILQHVKKGKSALKNCSAIIDKSMFEEMILKYEKIAIKAIEEKKQTVKFLKTYKDE